MVCKFTAPTRAVSQIALTAALTIVFALAARAQQISVRPPRTKSTTAPGGSQGFTFLPAKSLDSGGQLAWKLAVADLNGDGKPDLLSVNYGGESNGDGSVGVLLSTGNGNFRKVVAYDAGGGGPTGIAVGDLNGDGKPDLVVATQGYLNMTNDCVGVLIGNGDGTFQPVVVYPRGGRDSVSGPGLSTPVIIADLNGDGKNDLIVVNQTDDNYGDGLVGVLLGNGDGTFRPVATYDTGGFGAFAGFLGDLNGDGKADLVVLNCSPHGSSDCSHNGIVGVLLGNGDGTFKAVTKYDTGGLGGNSALVIADVNGDGKPDVLVGNSCPGNCTEPGSFGVLMGKGDGTLQGVVTYSVAGVGGVQSIFLGDLNGDGKPDLAVAGGGMGVDAWLNKGDGTFQLSSVNPSTGNSAQVLLTDLDGDGKLDIVDINVTSSTADTRLGNGDGTFQPLQTFKLGGNQISWGTIADINGDGRPDLLSANWCSPGCRGEEGAVGVLLNVASSPNPTSTTLTSSLNPSIYGQKVIFSATVRNSSGTIPTGQVSFTWSGHTLGVANLNSSGVATLNKSYLNADSYPLTAVYMGDANNLGSTSAILSQTVLQTTSAATISSSLNPSMQGQAVTFAARVTSPTITPAGPVTFEAGTTVLATLQLSNGKASYTTSSLPIGSTVIKVIYNGDSNIKGSSAAVTQVVQP